MRHLALLGLLVPSVGSAHPLVLYWSIDVIDGRCCYYNFELVAEEEFSGNVDAIVFADTGTGAPSNADGFDNYQWTDPNDPYTSMTWIDTGDHYGPGLENHPAVGWEPTGIGDSITWWTRAGNSIGVHDLYWSNLRGDSPLANYELAVNTCALLPDFEESETSCDGVDNDCDGWVDVFPDAPLADVQAGVCAGTPKACGASGFEEPDYALVPSYEAAEITCDGLDNDCNGVVDDIADAPLAMFQDGVCEGVTQVCDGAAGWRQPYVEEVEFYERSESMCDGLDNDCDGEVDNAIECYRLDGGCGCDAGTVAGAPWLLLAAALGLRRRRAAPAR